MKKYEAQYSNKHACWCLYQRETSRILRLMWPCKDEERANELADAMNTGEAICKGAKEIGNNCGTCVKCRCVL